MRVYVCVRETDRQTDRQTDKQKRQRQTETETETETERQRVCKSVVIVRLHYKMEFSRKFEILILHS